MVRIERALESGGIIFIDQGDKQGPGPSPEEATALTLVRSPTELEPRHWIRLAAKCWPSLSRPNARPLRLHDRDKAAHPACRSQKLSVKGRQSFGVGGSSKVQSVREVEAVAISHQRGVDDRWLWK